VPGRQRPLIRILANNAKALSPLFTVLSYAALFGVRYSSATYVALLPLTIGVMLACSFDLRANAMGFLCALGSTFIFVAQNIFSKKLLPKENSSIVRGELKASTGPVLAEAGPPSSTSSTSCSTRPAWPSSL
jgi:drug/metabolite transporter (DMT)-like permease